MRDIPSDTSRIENKTVFEEQFDGNFVPPLSPTDSEPDDCVQEIGGTGKILIA